MPTEGSQWTAKLKQGLQAILNGELSLQEAESVHGITCHTFQQYISVFSLNKASEVHFVEKLESGAPPTWVLSPWQSWPCLAMPWTPWTSSLHLSPREKGFMRLKRSNMRNLVPQHQLQFPVIIPSTTSLRSWAFLGTSSVRIHPSMLFENPKLLQSICVIISAN